MSERLYIFDTTLRDGEQVPGCQLNTTEKIEVAKLLESLGVDVIEAGFPISSPGDFNSVLEISKAVSEPTICALTRAVKKDIDVAADALRLARRKRIHTGIGVSPQHIYDKLRSTPEKIVESAVEAVKYAKRYVEDVEFYAEDAGRADVEYLARVVEAVIRAGATVVNIPDTTGYCLPNEYGAKIKYLVDNVPNIDRAIISTHCHNDLGMATANTLSGILNGARQAEVTINGIGERAGNTAMEEVVMAMRTRPDIFGDTPCRIDTTQIARASKTVYNIIGQSASLTKPIVGVNAFRHESGIHQHGVLANKKTYEILTPESVGIRMDNIVLGKHSGKHAFAARLKEMGYELPDEELARCFEEFKVLCDKKKNVTDQDILAIVTHSTTTDEAEVDGYKLMWFAVHTSNMTTSTSVVRLELDGQQFEAVCSGDGPVDAAFEAIDQIIRPVEHSFDLYRINSISPGKDTMGDVSVKLSCDNRTFSGRGLHTNIVEASVRAYISAMNKLRAYAARRAKGEV